MSADVTASVIPLFSPSVGTSFAQPLNETLRAPLSASVQSEISSMRKMQHPLRRVALTLGFMMATATFNAAATQSAALDGVMPVTAQHSQAAQTELVQTITSRLGQASGVASRFRQTQTLSALRTPVNSSGSLLFFREKGVVWTTTSPIEQTFVITDAGVKAWHAQSRGNEGGDAGSKEGGNGGGKTSRSIKGVAQVARMMQAMLSGDLSALYSQFDVRAGGTADAWQMDLSPNQPQLAQVIKSVRLRGGAFLDDIRITFSRGDVTDIALSQQRALTQLSVQQQRYFETQ